jgi:16S rRNA (adenine1518-N6/adenine1519-N6)-dimethyltransferase
MGPKKHLGQHFLTSVSHARRIAASVPAQAGENVLEIGSGNGALTVHLVKRYSGMHCVEIDPDAASGLSKNLGAGSWTLHQCDVLDFDFAMAGFPLHVVGNLPYSIGAMILRKTLLYGNNILSCTFMVQREVAQRIAAGPHTKQNGFLSVFCQFFGRPKLLFHVPAGAFFPKPNVDSTVFQLLVDKDLSSKLPVSRWPDYFSFVDRGFRMKRKMLANVLGRDDGRDRWARLLSRMGIPAGARAEDLSADQWLELYRLSCETPS